MKDELISRHSFFDYLYKRENDLIHLGDFGNFRLLTEQSNDGYSIAEVKEDLLQYYDFLMEPDIPFAREFLSSHSDKVLLFIHDNKIALADYDNYRIISSSIEELLGIDYQINFIISQGYHFQILNKAQNIADIISDNHFIEVNDAGYYEFSDYLQLLEDVFVLNKNSGESIAINGQEIREENDLRYQFDLNTGQRDFSFSFLESDEPNRIYSDDGFMNSIFLKNLNEIF
ncbi:hypothetical protein [Chryseobacterium sp. KBW03]|uniref:hypothetical protein n=1 Tax=Chryseobacterium sp. KBW03 TaxID=2153362 RepID=UPI000F5B44F3|nr:hypothetical protein [Chryseobacterium sp. KBW03]